MFDYPYIIELLSPKKYSDQKVAKDHLNRFANRYQKIIDAGIGLSIPDNPMGQPRMGALQSISQKDLPIDPDKIIMNLNTFHAKSELDELLKKAADSKLKFILVVRGDGGPLLSKLDPESIGGTRSAATSIDLIRYINLKFPGRFITGAAYNPYLPVSFELKRMEQKINAGAKFAITQPVIGKDRSVKKLEKLGITVVVEAWMSKNTDLLFKSVGKGNLDMAENYDPTKNLKNLHEFFPECSIYLSMLSFNQDWREILPNFKINPEKH